MPKLQTINTNTNEVAPPDRNLYLNRDVTQDGLNAIISSIDKINEYDKQQKRLYKFNKLKYKPLPIKLYISSYGGSVYCGLGLVGTIQSSKTPIHTIASGKVMSMGLILLAAGHKRYARPHTTFMYHSISSMTWGYLEDFKDTVDELQRLQNILDDIVLDASNLNRKTLNRYVKAKTDWYFDTKAASDYGLIKKVI